MDFIYLHEIEERNLLQFKWGGEGVEGRGNGGNVTNVQYKPNQNCHYESRPVQWTYHNENVLKVIITSSTTTTTKSNPAK
jgi:hypothetical protein